MILSSFSDRLRSGRKLNMATAVARLAGFHHSSTPSFSRNWGGLGVPPYKLAPTLFSKIWTIQSLQVK
jgi:hypothetical protein